MRILCLQDCLMRLPRLLRTLVVFFLDGPASTEFYTLSLHDALPISGWERRACGRFLLGSGTPAGRSPRSCSPSRWKSTRLNSSHMSISYAVFCLKKKKPAPDTACIDETTTVSIPNLS